jgi:hypothetical protein
MCSSNKRFPQEFAVTIGTLLGDDNAPGKPHSSLLSLGSSRSLKLKSSGATS